MASPTILIVGPTTPLGQIVAHRYARRGWDVALFDPDGESLRALAAEVGPEVFVKPVDPGDKDSVHDAVEEVAAWSGGRLDVLLNAPDWLCSGRFESLSVAQHRGHLNTNLWAPLVVSHAAFPLLRETDGARVINVAAAAGMYGTPDRASYSAAKAGLRALTQALNLEWAHHDVHVCDLILPARGSDAKRESAQGSGPDAALAPEAAGRPLAPNVTYEDVADVIDEAVAEDKIHWPVGKQFRWVYRLSDVLPAPIVRLLMRYMSGF